MPAAFYSCTQKPAAENIAVPVSFRNATTERDANMILFPYVKLTADSLLMLYLTRQEAAELGVTDEFYWKAVESILETNLFIIDYREQNPDQPIQMDIFENNSAAVPVGCSENASFPGGGRE